MSARVSGRSDRGRLWLGTLCAVLVFAAQAASAAAGESIGKTDATSLVVQALQAEVAGDAAQREALLAEAIEEAPDHDLARWSRGEIEVDQRWLPVEEAQQAAAVDPRRAEYLALRASYGDRLDGQLALARWCRRNDLDEEARIHWANVLAHQPHHEEAQRALGVRWYGGRLMTHAQIDWAKQRLRESRRAAKRWAPQLSKWERLLATGDIVSRDQALDEIRSLRSVEAIPAIEEMTLNEDINTTPEQERCRRVSLAFVEALGEMPDPAATVSLVRHAVFAPISDVQAAAIEGLKKRQMHDYVPLLLDALAMPIESSFRVSTDPDGSVHYWHSLYRDGRHADWSLENSRTTWQHDLGGRRTLVDSDGNVRGYAVPRESDQQLAGKVEVVAAQSQRGFAAEAMGVEQQVAQMNEAATALNERIIPVLAGTTGQDLGENPQAWWDWWRQYNEYYSSGEEEGEEPVYEQRYSQSSHHYYRMPSIERYVPPRPYRAPEGVRISRAPTPVRTGGFRPYCCLPGGTPVWTKTGRQAIESIQIGDLVLAQNVDTGELAYKPVVGRTVRPPTPIFKMTLGDEELHTTLGHPMWVAGIGWRMAKQIGEAAILHGVHGPVHVDEIEPAGEAEAFNFVVADFNTYFVGESCVLVHDNTPRTPTPATVPGLAVE